MAGVQTIKAIDKERHTTKRRVAPGARWERCQSLLYGTGRQDWQVGGGQGRQSEVSMARLSGVRGAFKGSGLYLTVET